MELKKSDRQKINTYFSDKLHAHGLYSPQTLDWNNDFSQFIRFKVLADIGNLDNKSILDAGCGLGDFYFYLTHRFKKFQYHGIDVSDSLLQAAKKKYPEATFETGELSRMNIDTFDYVFASGIFSQKIDNHKEKYFSLIKKLYTASTIGFAFNMLNREKHPDNETYAAYDIEEIKKYTESIANKIKVITGYLPHDFTMYLYK